MSTRNGHTVAVADPAHDPVPGGAETATVRPPGPAVVPLLWTRRDLARALAVGIATLARMEASGRIGPKPIRLNQGCVRYRAEECQEWVRQGCLPRAQWQALQATDRHNKKR